MPYSIPQEKIEQIRQATDIVDLISGYVTLKKRGKNYFGLCPFHPEKTPSFSVNPALQIFHCFGCGVGGNVFTFLMRQEGVSFPEAVRILAQRAGIPLPQQKVDLSLQKEREALYSANRFAARFFYQNLTSTREGQVALAYLRARGFDLEVIRKFGLGYSLNRWDGLIRHAKANSVDLEVLHRAGLIIQREDGGYYDRFRGRIMFPIINLSGMVVGFGGRRLGEDEDTPKYINSPETPIYHKGDVLYGLYQARDEIRKRDQVILVEGYTDLLSLYQNGIRNLVAASGTALTESQARLISRYTKNVTLLYDGDSAGSRATLRGMDILIENGLNVWIAELPSGEDPDIYVRERGAEGMERLLGSSLPFVDFKIKTFKERGWFSSASRQAEAIKSIVETVSKIQDEVTRNLTIKEVAEKLSVDERTLHRAMAKMTGKGKTGELDMEQPLLSQREAAERELVRLLIKEEELRGFIFQHLEIKDIKNETYRGIMGLIYRRFEEGKGTKLAELMDLAEDVESASFISKILLEEERMEEDKKRKLAQDCLAVIMGNAIGEEITRIRREIKMKERQGIDVSELVRKYQELEQKRMWIKKRGIFLK